MGRPVVIFGAGDFARIAAVYLREDSPHEVVAFTVHREFMQGDEFAGLPLVPFEDLEQSHPPSEYAMLVATGFRGVNKVRADIFAQCKERGYELISYICSKAIHWGDELQVGENTFIFEANVIQPGVTIGKNVVLWSGNHIGHDSTIEDNVFIASHAVISGNVTIGDSCFVGVNATFRDGITVAPRCVIGAGAVIMKNTQEGDVYAVRGTPAHEKKSWDLRL
jgi:sugar O-acyltransferase (sialic acid O-acetyltransferase NeuD family)